MTRGEKIKMIRERPGLSQTALADKINVSKQTMYKYENNIVTNIPTDKIEAIALVCHCTPEYLMGWEDEEPTAPIHPDIKDIKKYRTPMLGDVACGTPIVANPEYETYIETDFNPKANHCVRARGDSMIGARIYDGDIVFIKDCDMVDNGDIAVVIIDDEVTLKRFYYYPDQNIVQLIAENPAYAPLVYSGEEINHIKIVGKALFFQGVIK